MAVGNASFIKDIIDDTNKSIRTTYSSDRIESLLGQTGASSTVYLLTVGDVAPASPSIHDKYYNTIKGLVYEFLDTNKWDNGTNPSRNTLYVDLEHSKMYLYEKGKFVECSGITKISPKANNAIEELNGNDEGLYVEDLSQKVNQINIAQKTVNETLDSVYGIVKSETAIANNNYVPFEKVSGNLEMNDGKVKLSANKRYQITTVMQYTGKHGSVGSGQIPDINYTIADTDGYTIAAFNPLIGGNWNGSHSQTCQYTPTKDIEVGVLVYDITQNKTLWGDMHCTISVQEIGRVTTIDPVNYIDTTQGIQDVPVGTLINTEGPQNPEHYLLCDGTEYNIVDYRDLAEAIKKVYGSYNYFGGDGTITFAVPKYVDTNKWFSPKQTSNSNPYNVSASSSYNGWQIWWGFNNNCTTSASNAWHSAVGSTTGHWIQIDFKTIKPLNGISMAPRPEGNYNVSRMPRDFDIMGSNDGATWNIIKSYTGINDYENYKYREFIFDRPEKYRYYRIANIVITGDCVNIADIHFLEAPEKYVYIKYQPTYFIGNINGYEERKTLMDTPVLIPCTNGMLKPGTEIPLSESLDDYDYVEVHVGADYAGTPFGKHVTRIPTSEIIYSPTKTEWGNTYQEWICDQNTSFALWYGFKDVQTLYVGRMQANVNSDSSNYRGCQIIKIVGIRNRYKIS